MKKIIIIGGGGHAGITYDCIISQKKYEPIGYIDINRGNLHKHGIKYFGKLNQIPSLVKKLKDCYFIVGIGDNFLRYKIVNDLKIKNIKCKWATVIHPSASVSRTIKIGIGSLILSGSILSYNTLIKRHVCINTGASIDHDNFFGDYSSAGPGTVTGGNVRVNKLSYLAINSTVKHNILIGSNVVIGASSYVNRDCISNRVYYGIPAKEIRKRTIGENYL